ncbi:TIR domain-containing protein [Mesorhizobium sp. CA4]|uniref:TIR domain-containing protein n=1 Tax=Mesorhizobium sp. CA4 TaxID=588499 RepID=UPI001CD107B8|nr:nucleotide-binding protein [Mesorhizobium sp. CA4]MBZ9820621.1 nucleotide-binding protein [Mesorhizobium sp. CA4]
MKKRLFVGSSVGGLDAAYAAQENLEHDLEVTVWSQGVFELNKTSIEALYQALSRFDAAAFIFRGDDTLVKNGEQREAVRDNVLFELGLFIGRIGRDNCFLIKPRSQRALHFPTDLLGVTTADYDDSRVDGNLVAALGPACNRIKRAMVPPNEQKIAVEGDMRSLLLGQAYRLFFAPPNRSKRIRFHEDGTIVEGNNKNEHAWRIVGNRLELVQLDGRVHSRFEYDPQNKMFRHTNDADTLSLRGQTIVPDV